MRQAGRSLICSLIIAVSAAPATHAQTTIQFGDRPPTTDLTPAQRAFGNAYLVAIAGSDIERFKALLHPRTRACMNETNAYFFEAIFKRSVNRVVTDPRLSVETLPAKFAMLDAMEASGFISPVRATHVIHINLVSTGADHSSIAAAAKIENGTWYEVLPCPTAQAIEKMKEIDRRNEARAIKARELAASLRNPLRAELLAMLEDNSSVRAAKRYAEAAQVDLSLAMSVIANLKKQKR